MTGAGNGLIPIRKNPPFCCFWGKFCSICWYLLDIFRDDNCKFVEYLSTVQILLHKHFNVLVAGLEVNLYSLQASPAIFYGQWQDAEECPVCGWGFNKVKLCGHFNRHGTAGTCISLIGRLIWAPLGILHLRTFFWCRREAVTPHVFFLGEAFLPQIHRKHPQMHSIGGFSGPIHIAEAELFVCFFQQFVMWSFHSTF